MKAKFIRFSSLFILYSCTYVFYVNIITNCIATHCFLENVMWGRYTILNPIPAAPLFISVSRDWMRVWKKKNMQRRIALLSRCQDKSIRDIVWLQTHQEYNVETKMNCCSLSLYIPNRVVQNTIQKAYRRYIVVCLLCASACGMRINTHNAPLHHENICIHMKTPLHTAHKLNDPLARSTPLQPKTHIDHNKVHIGNKNDIDIPIHY